MLVQRHFTPTIAKRLETISIDELERRLETKEEIQLNETKPSKWAKIAHRLRTDEDLQDPEFQKAWKGVKESMREVHENSEFNHDR